MYHRLLYIQSSLTGQFQNALATILPHLTTRVTQTSRTQTSRTQTSWTQTSWTQTSWTQTSWTQTSWTQTSWTQTSWTKTSRTQTSWTQTSRTQTSRTQTSWTKTSLTRLPSGSLRNHFTCKAKIVFNSSAVNVLSSMFVLSKNHIILVSVAVYILPHKNRLSN